MALAAHNLFAKFPLYTYPDEPVAPLHNEQHRPTLWIAPPKSTAGVLSGDVECLKWQAYIALRGVKNVRVRWDISPDGSVDGRLPSLQTGREVFGPRFIPGWADEHLRVEAVAFEGYRDALARDESRAWVSILEGIVQTALTLAKPVKASFRSVLFYTPIASSSPLSTQSNPPAAPMTGISSIFPLYGERVSQAAIDAQYHDAVVSLSNRLGDDEWFLGSSGPTALDALVFAYLNCTLSGPDSVRIPVARRANLVSWERRVESMVANSYMTLKS